MAQDRDQWRAPVNTVIKLRFLKYFGQLLSGRAAGGFSRTQFRGVG
jgi:hypothetical protein